MIAARDNPFRSERVEDVAFRFGDDGWPALLRRLAAHGGRGLLLGPEGSGKTTLLEALAVRFASDGPVAWLRLRREPAATRARLAAFLATPVVGATVCIDGLEQLGRLAWWRAARHARSARRLIATSHHPGRLPVLRRHATSPALLGDLVAELAGAAPSDAEALWRRHGGNLRLCLRELYDRVRPPPARA
jgi:energy-coupling factor transporter ATP-binding protein EcfA2